MSTDDLSAEPQLVGMREDPAVNSSTTVTFRNQRYHAVTQLLKVQSGKYIAAAKKLMKLS